MAAGGPACCNPSGRATKTDPLRNALWLEVTGIWASNIFQRLSLMQLCPGQRGGCVSMEALVYDIMVAVLTIVVLAFVVIILLNQIREPRTKRGTR